jgi:RecA-family ATPase
MAWQPSYIRAESSVNALTPLSADSPKEIDWRWAFPDILEKLYGPPWMGTGLRQNYGSGLSVDFREGTWHSGKTGKRGGPRELVQTTLKLTRSGAERWLQEQGLLRYVEDREPTFSGTITATHDYLNHDGELQLKVVEFEGGEERPYLPDSRGGISVVNPSETPISLIPYRLKQLMAAPWDTPILLVQGEAVCDELALMGFAATTFPHCCGQWKTGFGGSAFRGRNVAIVAASTETAQCWAKEVQTDLEGRVGKVVQIELPRLAEGQGLLDWLRNSGSPAELRALLRFAFGVRSLEGLPLLQAGELAYLPSRPREWVWHEFLPVGQVALLTGAGGVGKSLFGQQLATAVALGRDCFGVPTMNCPALYVTCEDDQEELVRRQHSICSLTHISMQELDGKLHMSSWHGLPGNELLRFSDAGDVEESSRYKELCALCRRMGIRFVVLDNTAHLFGGDENKRQDVAKFTNLLNKLALEIRGAVLLIGHPNKAGDEFSGSTAWENQVRSRFFMDCPTDKDGEWIHPNLRTITRSKANYAQRGNCLEFHWHRGAFIRSEELPADESATLEAQRTAEVENKRFLECLAKVTAEQRSVSPHSSAANYAPRVFQKMPVAKGMKAKGFEAAMHRLLDAGIIAGDQPLWQRENRSWVRGLGLHRSPH